MKTLSRVRYLKAMDGVPDVGDILGARNQGATQMQAMWDALGGTGDALALYVKQKPDDAYNPLLSERPKIFTYKPEHVVCLLWFPKREEGQSVHDFEEDGVFDIGIPVARVLLDNAPLCLREALRHCYPVDFDSVWKSMRCSLTGGKPFQIDRHSRYESFGEMLTAYFSLLV